MAWFLTRPNSRQTQVVDEATIGRDPTCSIVLSAPSVSRVHCRLRVEGDRLVLENCSQYGTLVNERRVDRHQVVVADDVIDFPGHRITVVESRDTLPLRHEDAAELDGEAQPSVPRSTGPSLRTERAERAEPAEPSTDRKTDTRRQKVAAISSRAATASVRRPPTAAPAIAVPATVAPDSGGSGVRRPSTRAPSSAAPSTVAPGGSGGSGGECVLWVVEDEPSAGDRYCDAIAVGDEGSILLMLDLIETPESGTDLEDLIPQWRALLRLAGMRAASPDQVLEGIHRGMIQVGVKARGVCARVDVPERVALVSSAGGVAPWVVREGGRLASVRLPASVPIGTGRATRFAVRAVHFDRGDTLWVASEGWAPDLEAALAATYSTQEEVLDLLKAGPHARGGAVFCLARTK